MTFASIVVPAFNAADRLPETLTALMDQTYPSYEIIVVDDGSTDGTRRIAEAFALRGRVRVVHQKNRGLAGARNTGIAAALGGYIGFCDADVLWTPMKLARHVAHLRDNPEVGLSYSGSALIGEDGARLGQAQRPRLKKVTAPHIFKRNPIGNGSAVVVRRAVFDDIAFRPAHEPSRDWFFDETFRQSEDIECWLRIALTTSWRFEGIAGLLTRTFVNAARQSASTDRQYAAWEQMVAKLTPLNPAFFDQHLPAARAYQLRNLCRRAIATLDVNSARQLSNRWTAASKQPFLEEPVKSARTWVAACALGVLGPRVVARAMAVTKSTTQTGALS